MIVPQSKFQLFLLLHWGKFLMKRWPWRPLFFILCISESLCLLVFSVATAAQSTVTFDNQSGEEALVKLVGPSPASLSIPDKTHRTVPVSPGRYTMMARYGDNPQRYRYTKGEDFEVETPQKEFTATQIITRYPSITITLHPVIDGNYDTWPISREEFERAGR